MSFSGYPAVGFSWCCTYIVRAFSSLEFFPGSEMGILLLRYLTFSFILSRVCCPSSTCRANFSRTDICPVSLIPELLGMVDKA